MTATDSIKVTCPDDGMVKPRGRIQMTWMSTYLACTAIFAGLSAADVMAEDELITVAPASDISSLVEIAMINSPSVQQALADVQKAKGIRYQSTRSPNPVAGYTASEIGNDGRAGQQGVFWSQTFRRSEKLHLNNQIGRWDVEATTWAWQAEQNRVTGNVRIRWYTAAAVAKKINLLMQLQEVLESAVKQTKAMFDAGESGRTPHLQAQLELRRIQLQIRNTESSLEAARKQLASAVATSVDALPCEFQGLDESQGSMDEASYLLDLLANSPELHLSRARISQHQSNVCRQQIEPKTDLQTQFSVQYDDSTDDTVSGIQLGVTLPLFDRNKGNISAANADYLKACQEVRRKEYELSQQAAGVHRDFTVADREVQTIDSELLPLAKENLKVSSESFRAGEATYQSLLTAQRSYVELIVSRIDAQRRTRQAEAMLNSYLMADEATE